MSKALELSQLANNLTITEGTDTVTLGQANVVLSGNLQVDGTSTTLNTSTLTVDDLNITIADGAANAAAADGAGLTVDGASATLIYGSTNDNWSFNKQLNVAGDVVITSEGVNASACLQINNTDSSANYPKAIEAYNSGISVGSRHQIMLGKDGSTNDTATLNFYYAGDASSSNRFAIGFWGADDLLVVEANGNVGIGTNDPAEKLDVRGTILSDAGGGDANAIGNLGGDFSTWIRVGDGNTAQTQTNGFGMKLHDAGVIHWSVGGLGTDFKISKTNSAGEELFPATRGDYFTIDTNGNVSIGSTLSPGAALVVDGTGTTATSGSTLVLYDNSTTAADVGGSIMFSFDWNGTNGHLGSGPFIKGYKLNADTTDFGSGLQFGTRQNGVGNNAVAMTIDPQQRVGIGTTAPESLLYLLQTAETIDDGIKIVGSSGPISGRIYMNGEHLHLDNATAGANSGITLDDGGNVGVGTATPSNKLTIDIAANNTGITLSDHGDGFFPQIIYDANRSSAGQGLGKFTSNWNGTEVARIEFAAGADTTNKDDGEMLFYTKTSGVGISERMRIDDEGNVGIGTNAPADKFVVRGDGARMTVNSIDYEVAMLGRRGSSGAALDRGYLRLRKDGVTNDGVVIDTDGASWFNGGDVGIGTTQPAANLHLHGTGDMIRLTSTNDGSGGSQIDMLHFSPTTANEDIMGLLNMGGYYTGTTSAYFSSIRTIATDAGSRHGRLEFLTVDDSTLSTKMTINHLGNVGMGTTNPEAELHVKNSSTPRIRVETTSTSTTDVPGLEFYKRGVTTDGTDLAIISFNGNDSASNLTRYGYIFPDIMDSASGSEDGRIFMSVISGGNENQVFYEMNGEAGSDNPLTSNHEFRGRNAGHIMTVRRDIIDQSNSGAVLALMLGENTGPEDDPWIDFYNYGTTGSGGEQQVNGSIGTVSGNQGTFLWGYETLMLRATTDSDMPNLTSTAGTGLTINSSSSTFYGDLDVTGDVTAFSSSDQRLKTDLQPIENSLDKVKSLTGYTFNWNELAENKSQDQREAGVLAQDVEAVLPEVTTTRDDGYKSVRYEKMVPMLIEAIKELSDKVDTQQQEIERLRNQS